MKLISTVIIQDVQDVLLRVGGDWWGFSLVLQGRGWGVCRWVVGLGFFEKNKTKHTKQQTKHHKL